VDLLYLYSRIILKLQREIMKEGEYAVDDLD